MRLPGLLIMITALLAMAAPGDRQASEDSAHFVVTGEVEADVREATASMIRIRNKLPALNMISSPAATTALGASFSVNPFFPEGFEPQVGVFPISFKYHSSAGSLGASPVATGKLYSHDTLGTAEFLEFGDRVTVRFEFEVARASEGTENRKLVRIQGEASCAKAEIF